MCHQRGKSQRLDFLHWNLRNWVCNKKKTDTLPWFILVFKEKIKPSEMFKTAINHFFLFYLIINTFSQVSIVFHCSNSGFYQLGRKYNERRKARLQRFAKICASDNNYKEWGQIQSLCLKGSGEIAVFFWDNHKHHPYEPSVIECGLQLPRGCPCGWPASSSPLTHTDSAHLSSFC